MSVMEFAPALLAASMASRANAPVPRMTTSCTSAFLATTFRAIHSIRKSQIPSTMERSMNMTLPSVLTLLYVDQIRLHLFQPHQADQMFDPQRTGSSYASRH